ncbi:MAG: protease complex subunit PrcB family protein [Lachnospiraceae bacterium]|nr:protease complex subunit PrcB family protein [Lachnospiraceae bacterium]
MKSGKMVAMGMLLACVSMGSVACNVEKQEDIKVRDIEFTVLKESEIPEDIMELVDEKKNEEFRLAKTKDSYTYVLAGYGKQETGGFSIQVEDIYLGENAVYVDTELMGPAKNEKVSEAESYPFIVVKMEHTDEPIIFK